MFFLFLLAVVLYFLFAIWRLRWAVLLLPLFFPLYLLHFTVSGIPFTLIEGFIDAAFLAWVVVLIYEKIVSYRLRVAGDRLPDSDQVPNSGYYVSKWFSNLVSRLPSVFRRMPVDEYRDWYFWLPVLLIVVAAFISTFIVPNQTVLVDGTTIFYGQKVALGILKGWIITPILMLVLFFNVLKNTKDFQYLFNSYIRSSVILALWAIFQVMTATFITPDSRASGPFESANYLALYIAPAVFYTFIKMKDFFAAYRKQATGPKWQRIFDWLIVLVKNNSASFQEEKVPSFFIARDNFLAFAFFLLAWALLLTKSYAAIFALITAIVIYLLFENFPRSFRGDSKQQRRFWLKFFVYFLVCLAGIVCVIFLLDPAKLKLFFEFSARTSSSVRLEIYRIAVNLIKEHPLFGIGLGQFPAVYQLEAPRILGHAPYEWNMLHPHNVFLAFWLNLGLLGLTGFVWILVLCFKNAWAGMRNFAHAQTFSSDWWRVVGFFMLLIVLLHGLFDTSFFKNDLALIFWLIVGSILL